MEPIDLVVGMATGFFLTPIQVAYENGWFEEQGLNVEIVRFEGAGPMTAALLSGDIDIIGSGMERPALLRPDGQSVTALAALMDAPIFTVVGRPELEVPEGDLTARMEALRGLALGHVGVGGADHALSLMLLSRAGMTEADLTLLPVGIGPPAVAAAEQGEVDALVNVEPDGSILRERGFALLIDTRNPDHVGSDIANMPMSAALARTEWLDENDEAARRFLRGLVRAQQFIREDDSSIESILPLFPGIEESVITSVWEQSRSAVAPQIDPDGYAQWMEALFAAGVIEAVLPYEEAVATGLQDEWD